jgi:hypothetical protein
MITDKQTLFLDTFLEALEAGVSEAEAFRTAKQFAQYSDNTSKRDILTDDVYTEIQTYYNRKMVMKLSKADRKMDSLLDDPAQDGASVLLAAVNSVHDRGGVIKKESKEITIKAPTGVVFMPAKAELDAE